MISIPLSQCYVMNTKTHVTSAFYIALVIRMDIQSTWVLNPANAKSLQFCVPLLREVTQNTPMSIMVPLMT